jgi:hypothetical protein
MKAAAQTARGIGAEIPQDLRSTGRNFAQQNCCPSMQPGKAEELERIARFLACSGLVTILHRKIVARLCVQPKTRPNSELKIYVFTPLLCLFPPHALRRSRLLEIYQFFY